ncbi:hypothetical protein ZOSMA_2G01880 [Zostera marina]|uniref:Ninja-family protein n=1 Tax=Zostera marina TaxID=29655 RepID=A0A0K9PD74_ZOSMR|nr:hypothetical protein ZOSMA_2G01880 [Zostera marina]
MEFENRKIFENGREVIIVEEVLKHPTSETKERSSNSNKIIRQNGIPNSQPTDTNIIRPGVASGLIFGGNGSCPDLPWVSTTGSGPNGKTISGVTYKYNKTQVNIVCACHGLHLSPEEFVHHANLDDAPRLDAESNPGNNAASSHN